MSKVVEKFIEYVKIDTEPVPGAGVVPTTEKEFDLARVLVKQLQDMGVPDVRLDEKHCFVYATIPSNLPEDKKVPAIGFMAHMDTAPDMSGKDVKPRVLCYEGGDIVLNEELNIVMKISETPELPTYIGKHLIVTDGTTLLGADDKAGIAEIMEMAEYFMTNPEVPHGTIKIAFTPDEEGGGGIHYFDIEAFGADGAYTVDGGILGGMDYECFNAAGAELTITGYAIHPGSAKGRMLNAALIGMEFNSLLPVEQIPAYTEGAEGFFHLSSFTGNVDQAVLDYAIRDHDRTKFEQKKALFLACAEFLNTKYGRKVAEVKLTEQYCNMKEMIIPEHTHLIDNANEAMRRLGITPINSPIRGGTDGSTLSFRGLPCPNLCTGGHNCHGRFEYACVEEMESCVEILKNIIKIYAE
ncbi:MAG: peptidase T [Lachnospiraceae bacterium]|nr:peptidase T [Lachnospiraceae bacterium]